MNDLKAAKRSTLLHGYIPQSQDILCGKCKESFNHVGNRRFRITVSLFLKRYNATSSRTARGALIASVVDMIHNNGCRFLKKEMNHWVVLNKQQARSKVGHALRDAAFHLHKASSKQTEDNNSRKSTQEGEKDEFIPQPTKRETSVRRRSERIQSMSVVRKHSVKSDAWLDARRFSISQLGLSEEGDNDELVPQPTKHETSVCRRSERIQALSVVRKHSVKSDAWLDARRMSISQLDFLDELSSCDSDDEQGFLGRVGQIECL